MTEADWFYDDPKVADDEELLRRIPWGQDYVVFDAQAGKHFPTTAAFRRRKPGEGLSVHMRSVVEARERAVASVYDGATSGTVTFTAEVPRTVGAGVVPVEAPRDVESDAVRREAHAEVRPPTFALNKGEWTRIRVSIIDACRWVVVPDCKPASPGTAVAQ